MFDKLITNNNGYSSKSFTLVVGVILVCFIVIINYVIILIDLYNPLLTISINLVELNAIIGGLGILVGYLFKKKVDSEKKEKEKDDKLL